MKLSNILIPFESSEFGLRERDMNISRDLHSIQVIEHNFYKLPKKGYILVNNTNPKFPYDVKFKFFIYGGKVNQSINTGMLIEESQFKAWFSKNSQNPLFLEMIGDAMYSTKSNLYNNDVKVSFKYFIDILELSGCIGDPNKFKLSSYNEFKPVFTAQAKATMTANLSQKLKVEINLSSIQNLNGYKTTKGSVTQGSYVGIGSTSTATQAVNVVNSSNLPVLGVVQPQYKAKNNSYVPGNAQVGFGLGTTLSWNF